MAIYVKPKKKKKDKAAGSQTGTPKLPRRKRKSKKPR